MKYIILALLVFLIVGVFMSLHDIDKTSDSRTAPLPNSNDDVSQRMAQGTGSVQNTNDVDEVDGLQFRERQIVAVQDGENKAAFGFYGAANKFGLKVAKDGYDVLTAADSELVFNSEQNVFKIVQTGTASMPALSTGIPGAGNFLSAYGSKVISHNLGYKPAILAYLSFDNTYYQALPYNIHAGTGGSAYWLTVNVLTTDSTVFFEQYITAYGPAGSGWGTYTVKYYLLQETAD